MKIYLSHQPLPDEIEGLRFRTKFSQLSINIQVFQKKI